MSLSPELQAKLDRALKFRGLIEAVARYHNVDPDIITALVAQESAGDPLAKRREPDWSYFWAARELADKLGHTYADELEFQRTSYGLMQLMGSNFRAGGFEGRADQIAPEVGLFFAVPFFKNLTHRWGEETDWISAYNQGSPRKTVGGLYLNQKKYVDPVCQYLRELRKLAD